MAVFESSDALEKARDDAFVVGMELVFECDDALFECGDGMELAFFGTTSGGQGAGSFTVVVDFVCGYKDTLAEGDGRGKWDFEVLGVDGGAGFTDGFGGDATTGSGGDDTVDAAEFLLVEFV